MNSEFLSTIAIIALFAPLAGFVSTLLLNKWTKNAHYAEMFFIGVNVVAAGTLLVMTAGDLHTLHIISSFNWIQFPGITIELGFQFDSLSIILLFGVALISFLVHTFSLQYMHGDKRYSRYFAYLGIFTFSMNGIVITNNLLMMYIFWELVGLSSYLLIGFWFEKTSASDAAKKAFIANRFGDFGMLAGILLVFVTFGTFSFDGIKEGLLSGILPFNSGFWLSVMGVLLFCGAIGKSAQFPLHVWLPDAMEGPTPVSALIHAATMVAAGVYMVIKIYFLLSADALLVIAIIGALSALIPATIAFTQYDIKKVLAYSTLSQLGLMVMAIGLGAFGNAFFHLMTHAFFKAGLFLAAGSVIYGMHHEQDIRHMGGLKKYMPKTFLAFAIYTLAISGVPLTSGFMSKDAILNATMIYGSLTGNWIFAVVGFGVTFLTAFYMFRLLFRVFIKGNITGVEHHILHGHKVHESPNVMVVPLLVLAALSLFPFFSFNPLSGENGWLMKGMNFASSAVPDGLRYTFMTLAGTSVTGYTESYFEASHHYHYIAMALSLLCALGGFGLAYTVYFKEKVNTQTYKAKFRPVYTFLYNKWYFDELYEVIIVKFTLLTSRVLFWFDATVVDGLVNLTAFLTRKVSDLGGLFDKYVVDGFVNFTAMFTGLIGLFMRKLQTGKIQTYVAFIVVSIVLLFFFYARQ